MRYKHFIQMSAFLKYCFIQLLKIKPTHLFQTPSENQRTTPANTYFIKKVF